MEINKSVQETVRQETEVMEGLSSQFDAIKTNIAATLARNLADEDPKERQGCANYIRDKVIPAMALDDDNRSREMTIETLHTLMRELRPPRTEREMSDLDNAAFHYARLMLKKD